MRFAPTTTAQENPAKESIPRDVYVTGNTAVDALFLCLEKLNQQYIDVDSLGLSDVDFDKRVILPTGHRRESFGQRFRDMGLALRELASGYLDVEIIYPIHLNPNGQAPVDEILANQGRVHLIPPVAYSALVPLMRQCRLVLTDSGRTQEEAAALGKPVLVMRNVTERMEGIPAGTAQRVGTDREVIVAAVRELLDNDDIYHHMSQTKNPYGDGTASTQTVTLATKYRYG